MKTIPRYIIVISISLLVIAGSVTSYLAILRYLHNEHEKEERRNIEIAIKAVPINPNLPFVLIIGDSISVYYTLPVKLRLEGVANVMRPLENCGSTLMILEKLDSWLGQTQWAVIHFNAGLHDLEHVQYENMAPGKQVMVSVDKGPRWISVQSYRSNLERIVGRLKKTNAKLVFATTTPVPIGERNRVPEDVALYNEAALAVMHEQGVLIDDLSSAIAASAYRFQKPQDVHFNQEGSNVLAEYVAASIKAALPGKP